MAGDPVLVTGATGFTGGFVVNALLARGHEVGAFVRSPERAASLASAGVRIHGGDLDRSETLEDALRGYGALANVASLGFGHAPGIVAAARAADVRRAVFVSTTAIFTRLAAPSKRVRTEAEETVRKSGLDWTILRPTMIYGTPDDRNVSRLLRLLRRFPVLVIPGPGKHLLQPVHVEDVADAVAEAIERPSSAGRAYDVSGAEPVTFNGLVDAAGRAVGRRVLRIHLPLGLACAAATATRPLLGRRGISAEQIRRLDEDKAFSHADAARDLGYRPRTIEEGLRSLAALLDSHS